VLCEQHMRLLDTTVRLSAPSSDHLLGARLASASKGGPRKVPTVVSKSLICCPHNNVGTNHNIRPELHYYPNYALPKLCTSQIMHYPNLV
jgi:hypothetical protein